MDKFIGIFVRIYGIDINRSARKLAEMRDYHDRNRKDYSKL